MPRRRSRRQIIEEDEEAEVQEEQATEAVEEEADEAEDEVVDRKRKKRKSTSSRRRSRRVEDDDDGDEDEDEEEENDEAAVERVADNDGDGEIMFSSQVPEMSQTILPVRNSERDNLMKMSEAARSKAIRDLTRLVLFKGFAGEPIDRTKCVKEAGFSDSRISSAVFDEVNVRLQNIFGYQLMRLPKWMEKIKGLPARYKDRYYLINNLTLDNDSDGAHSKAIHSVHDISAVEKGLLMVVLAMTYCKGDPRADGSRWILDKDLYALLHRLDDNIPGEPPRTAAHNNNSSNNNNSNAHHSHRSRRSVVGKGALTPAVDDCLAKFCHRDYLMREKAVDESGNNEEQGFLYTMGPRAVMEVGRRQVIFFCAEILDEDPDQTMLLDLEDEHNEEEQ